MEPGIEPHDHAKELNDSRVQASRDGLSLVQARNPLIFENDTFIAKFHFGLGNEGAVMSVDAAHPPDFKKLFPNWSSHQHRRQNSLLVDSSVQVELCDRELWEQFSRVGTEMIVTKSGRRMFPHYRVKLSGLDPNKSYCVLLDVINVDEHRYKFQQGEWMIAGKGEPHAHQRAFLHPDSPSKGHVWMNEIVTFCKVKLTNSYSSQSIDKIVLNSMHRYQPRIHIAVADDISSLPVQPMSTFAFPQTVFITVTAYQNGQVTKLKINNNPFAKGFRENGGRSEKSSSSSGKKVSGSGKESKSKGTEASSSGKKAKQSSTNKEYRKNADAKHAKRLKSDYEALHSTSTSHWYPTATGTQKIDGKRSSSNSNQSGDLETFCLSQNQPTVAQSNFTYQQWMCTAARPARSDLKASTRPGPFAVSEVCPLFNFNQTHSNFSSDLGAFHSDYANCLNVPITGASSVCPVAFNIQNSSEQLDLDTGATARKRNVCFTANNPQAVASPVYSKLHATGRAERQTPRQ